MFPARLTPQDGARPLTAFGRYDLLRMIGESADAEVFVARCDGFDGLFRTSALKRLRRGKSDEPAAAARLIEEARVLALLEHPHTLSVHDFGRVGGTYFLATDLVDGSDLATLLLRARERGIAVDPRIGIAVARAVAAALSHLHGMQGPNARPLGLSHGDIQPKNILVGRDGTVKLKGFMQAGLSRVERIERVGAGGMAYQPPEVHAGARGMPTADVWGLGAVLWELLTGAPLFGAHGDVTALGYDVAARPIVAPSQRNPDLPRTLDGVVLSLLTRDATQRGKIGEALEELTRLSGGADAAVLAEHLNALDTGESGTARLGTPQHRGDASPTADASPAPDELGGREPTRLQRRVKEAPVPLPVELVLRPVTAPATVGSGISAEEALSADLQKDPGVWGLVRFGERLAAENRKDDAVAAFRTAAVLNAGRGLLVQAVCAYDGARRFLRPEDVEDDLHRLASLPIGDAAARQSLVRRVGGSHLLEALRAQDRGFDSEVAAALRQPFFGALDPSDFAIVASRSPVRRVQAGRIVLREGEPGDSLFLVGEGNLVVTCVPARVDAVDDDEEETTDPKVAGGRGGVIVKPSLERELTDDVGGSLGGGSWLGGGVIPDPDWSRRVFLSALSAGDVFGEFSFLTGRPRAASVEAVTNCRLIEISRRTADPLFDEYPTLKEALETFFKERVLEWLLAKSEVFSLLEPEARKQLLSSCGVYDVPAGKVIVREGELHDAMYFIRKGEVEVSTTDDGLPVFVNKLAAGDFFGEIAMLAGGPRRASVRAISDAELFRITRDDLQQILDSHPEVKDRLIVASRRRSAELRARVEEQRRLMSST